MKSKMLNIFLLLIVGLLQSCVKEEFLKVCYDSSSSGCVSIDKTSGPIKEINFSMPSQGIAENGGLAYANLELTQPSSLEVVVPFVITGLAKYTSIGRDYTVQGLGVSFNDATGMGSVVIPAGATVKSIIINVDNDSTDEYDENIIITLLTPTNATLGSVNLHEIVIADEDLPPLVNWSTATSSYNEDAGLVSVQAVLSQVSGKDVSLNLTVSSVDMALFVDHNFTANTLYIPAGSLNGSVSFSILDDTALELTETLDIAISGTNNASPGATLIHTMTVTDDDTPPEIFIPGSPSETFVEQNVVKNLVVEVTKACGLDINIPYVLSGTATEGAGNDYIDVSAVPGVLTIPAGDTTGIISISMQEDTKIELLENLIVSLNSPVGGCNAVLSPTANSFTYNTTDDEPRAKMNFTSSFQAQSYDNSSIQAKVEIDTILDYDISIQYTVSSTLTNPTQHNLSSGSVIISAGNTTATISGSLTTNQTDFLEGTITLTLIDTAFDQTDLDEYGTHTISVLNPTFVTIPQGLLTFDEIASDKVNDIHSPDGVIYIATNGGLSYSLAMNMNGGFVSKTTSDGLPSNKINTVFADVDPVTYAPTIYAGTNKGLAISTNGKGFNTFTVSSTGGGLPSDNILSVAAKDKYVIVGTDMGAAISDDGGLSWVKFNTVGTGADDLPNLKVNHVSINSTLKVTYCTDEGVTQRDVDDTAFEAQYLTGEVCIKYKQNATESKSYVLTKNGLRLGPNLAGLGSLITSLGSLTLSKLTDMEIKPVSDFVLISGEEGVILSTDSSGTSYVTDVSLLPNGGSPKIKALTIHTDPFGTPGQDTYFLGASERSGVAVYEDYSFGWIEYDFAVLSSKGLPSQKINDIVDDLELVIAHQDGISHSVYDAINDEYNEFQDIAGITYEVNALHHDNLSNGGPNARIYYGGYAGAFGYLDANGLTYPKIADQTLSNTSVNVTDILSSEFNDIYVSTANNGIFYYESVGLESVFDSFLVVEDAKTTGTGLVSNKISKIIYDPVSDGYCYTSFDNGGHCTSSDLNNFPAGSLLTGTTGGIINDIFTDSSGNMYLASDAQIIRAPYTSVIIGLPITFSQTIVIPFTDKKTNSIVASSALGLTISGSNEGIAVTPDFGISFKTFTTSDGLPDNQISKIIIGSDGYVYVGTVNGLARSRLTLADFALP